ncbi:hypothetical protein ACPVPU_06140 [Sphingomonas sp. CJ99]
MARVRMMASITAMALMLGGCMMPLAADAGYPPQAIGEFGAEAADYAWIDRADALWEAIGEAPPDFSLASGGGDPQWVWVTADGYWVITEPVGPDGVRGYYFEPGAMLPFLVRDTDWSYGFSGERLAVVYGGDGRLSTTAPAPVQRADAIELLRRGQMLRAEADGQGRRDAVRPEIWAGSAPLLWDNFATWDFGYAADPLWGSYRRSPGGRAERERWRLERERRRARAEAFRDWRERGFVGEPPPGLDRPGRLGRPGRPETGGRPIRPGRPDGNAAPPILSSPDPIRRPVRREDALRPDRIERAPAVRPTRPQSPPGAIGIRPDRDAGAGSGRRPPGTDRSLERPAIAPPPGGGVTGRGQPTRPLYTPERAGARPVTRPATPMVRPSQPAAIAPAPPRAAPPPPPRAAPPPPPPPRIMQRMEPAPQLSPE